MKEELEIKPCFCGRMPYGERYGRNGGFTYKCKTLEGNILDHEIFSAYSSTEEGAIKKWNAFMDSIKNVYKEKQDAPSADKENATDKRKVKMKTYKVIRNGNTDILEAEINELAKEGYVVHCTYSAEPPIIYYPTTIVILEKESE